MRTVIEGLAEEAELLIRDQGWSLAPADRALAEKTIADLRAAVGPGPTQEALPLIDRLERLRETLAALAIALAKSHGRLAWFLGAAVTALAPVLHWRALPDAHGPTFGAVKPTVQQCAEAEDAVRLLQATLTRIIAA
ncbi:hypothetical protein [Streptodolium elevatio]|uniref:Uncharacterized protein n=1 Tax=Streptodolium elevatio TaxID=3157996 RepID=A0ABV3DWZ1_9ACTN